MATFGGKIFNPEAFGAYMEAVPNVKLNKLRESKAVVSDKRLEDLFKNNTQTGTTYGTLPYFGLIGGEALNYDGETDIVPQSTTSFKQGVFTYGRMQAWTEADFSYDVTGGVDFMANVRSQVMDYWNNVDQDVLLSILKGVFSMQATGSSKVLAANKKFVDNHTFDISQSGTDTATTEEMKVGPTSLNACIQKACGDNKKKFSLILCHSEVATNLENLNLLAYLKYTDEKGIERELELGTWNGRLVVVDDSMPVEVVKKGGGGAAVNIYTSYVLGEGAIGFNEVGAKVPYEVKRDAFKNGGEDTLISRRRNAVSVSGISYTQATQSKNSPTNAELATGNNWTLINDGTDCIADKAVPIARIISRG